MASEDCCLEAGGMGATANEFAVAPSRDGVHEKAKRRFRSRRWMAVLAATAVLAPPVLVFAQAAPPTPPTGRVWSLGNNTNGQLGVPCVGVNAACHRTPSEVPGPEDVVSVAGGNEHSVAVAANGAVWAWGNDQWCQLGNGRELCGPALTPTSQRSRTTPAVVRDASGGAFSGASAVAAGSRHSVALDTAGQVWGWGDNSCGQLGVGVNERVEPLKDPTSPTAGPLSSTPVKVAGALATRKVVAVAAGAFHTLALDSEGRLWAWGDDAHGQLGVRPYPQGAVSKSLGDACGAQSPEGVVLSPAPVLLPQDVTMKALAAGAKHSLAIDGQGRAWAWGDNTWGQTATGNRTIPSLVLGLPANKIVAVAGGGNHSLVGADDGTVWGWGLNGSGQLADGAATPRGEVGPATSALPVQVRRQDGAVLEGVRAVAGGSDFSLAVVDADGDGKGNVWGWGGATLANQPVLTSYSYWGQTGRETGSLFPREVPGITIATGLSAGGTHSLVLVNGLTSTSGMSSTSSSSTTSTSSTSSTSSTTSTTLTTRVGVGDPGDPPVDSPTDSTCLGQDDVCREAPVQNPLPARPLAPGTAARGGVFLTERRSPEHTVFPGPPYGNPPGARYIIRQAVAYVTGGEERPKVLLVNGLDDSRNRYTDPYWTEHSDEMGMRQAGFAYCGKTGSGAGPNGCYDLATYNGDEYPGAKRLDSVQFSDYHAIVVGPQLDIPDMNYLEAHRDELMAYIDGGGGLVGFGGYVPYPYGPNCRAPAWSPYVNPDDPYYCGELAKRDRFPDDDVHFYEWRRYLPFFLDWRRNVNAAGEYEPLYDGFQLTDEGRAMGLTDSDVDPGVVHGYFTESCGFDVVEADKNGHIVSMAAHAPIPTSCWGLAGQDLRVEEGDGGVNAHSISVTRSERLGEAVTLHYQTADGTAKAGDDYVATSGSLTFGPNEAKKTVEVGVVGDLVVEDDERFSVELRFDDVLEGALPPALVTIANDDKAPADTPPDDGGNQDDGATAAEGDTTAPEPAQTQYQPQVQPQAQLQVQPQPQPQLQLQPQLQPQTQTQVQSQPQPQSQSQGQSQSQSQGQGQGQAQVQSAAQLQGQLAPQFGAALERERQAELETERVDEHGGWLASAVSRPNPVMTVGLAWGVALIAIIGGCRTTRRGGRARVPAGQLQHAGGRGAVTGRSSSPRARRARHHRVTESSVGRGARHDS